MSTIRTCLVAALALLASGCSSATTSKDACLNLRVNNPAPVDQPDALVWLSGADLPDFLRTEPAVVELEGAIVPSQAVDDDRDGRTDRLALLLNLPANSHCSLLLRPLRPDEKAPVFPRRAHAEISRKTGGQWKNGVYEGGTYETVPDLTVPPEHVPHSTYIRFEGPGWESDLVGYRLYLDRRNAIDVFGKTAPGLILDKIGHLDELYCYEPQPWGADVIRVGNSLGVGGFGLWRDGAARHVSCAGPVTSTVIADGPIYASHRIAYRNCLVGNARLDMSATLSISAGSRITWVSFMGGAEMDNICAGLLKRPNTEVIEGPSNKRWSYLATYGVQGEQDENLGVAIIYPTADMLGTGEDADNRVVLLRPEAGAVHYGLVSVWEKEKDAPRGRDGFVQYLDRLMVQLSFPPTVDRDIPAQQTTATGTTVEAAPLSSEAALGWAVRLANSEMKRRGRSLAYGELDPEINRPARWSYTTGLEMMAFEALWKRTGERRFLDYSIDTIGSYINPDGSIIGYSPEEYNIDHINPGRNLLHLYKATDEERFLIAARHLRAQLDTHPRNPDGGFWHKQRYPKQMWLDGLYMGAPFYAEYTSLYGPASAFDDIALQFILMERHARDPKTGLLYHAFDMGREQSWANPETGCSPNFWGRSLGWYGMALVDVLDFLPADHPSRGELLAILGRFTDAMLKVQDKSGLWWQVPDQSGREGNYLEASASAMMAYTLAKAANKGWLGGEAAAAALRTYEGMIRELCVVEPDGSVSLTHVCQVAGLGFGRDGSYEYYLSEPVVSNDAKGVGPFILASLEIETLLKAQGR